MKIAHLADVHIGKKLEEIDRNPEIEEALKEVCALLEAEQVRVALIAGDIFDHSRPSVESLHVFYRFLNRLKTSGVEKILIIAGNHDNDALLEVAREFLEFSGIHIWGRLTAKIEDYFLDLNLNGEELFIAALPYLNEYKILSEIHHQHSSVSPVQRYLKTYEALLSCFKEEARKRRGTRLFMGHLFLEGSIFSLSERQASLEEWLCVPLSYLEAENPFDYCALGHIHRQQKRSSFYEVHYAGSLIRLNFAEKNDSKGFMIYDTATGKAEPRFLKTPKILEEIEVQAANLEDLQNLAALKDEKKIYKVRVYYGEALTPKEVRETLMNVLGPQIKTEILSVRQKEKSLSENRQIQNSEDFLWFYRQYKKESLKPEVEQRLKEILEGADS